MFSSGVCLPDKMIPIHFLLLCKVQSILNHESVGRGHRKMLLNDLIYLHGMFCCFLS